MSNVTYRGTLTAVSPLHHGGDEQTGNVRLLRSIKTYDPNQGKTVRLPLISGNAIRGQLRRRLMRDMLERVNYGPASAKLHHALYTGGLLESVDTGGAPGMDLGFRRKLRDTIPPLGLLGSAIGNEMLEGSLNVRHAVPICAESAWWLTAQGYDDARLLHPSKSFRDFTFTTRRDDLRADESTNQMIVTFEVFAPGTAFAHSWKLKHATPEEHGALAHAADLWQEDPTIGGKAASGFGELMIAYEGLPPVDPYLRFLDANGDAIRSLLDDLAKRLEGKPKQGTLLDQLSGADAA
jgi:hypothetical protein